MSARKTFWGAALPSTWAIAQVKNAATVTLGKMLQSNDSGNDTEAPYLRAANVQPDGVLQTDDVKRMWFAESELTLLDLRRGDVVVVEGGVGGYGRAAFVEADLEGFGFQNSINRLRPRHADGRFLAYYLIAARERGFLQAQCNVVSMPHLTSEKLAATPFPQPPMREQSAIADFLDRETARVDELIGKQRRLISFLRERRTVEVESAVLQGLDEPVPGREVDRQWLPGRVPEVWSIQQLGFRVESLSGLAFPSEGFTRDANATRLLRGVNIKPNGIDWSETVRWDELESPVDSSYRLRENDVVVGLDRPFVSGGVRVAALTAEDLPALLLQRVMVLRAKPGTSQNYLRLLLGTQAFRSYLAPLFTGVSVPHMSEWQVRKFVAPFPPLNEQERIAAYVAEKAAKTDSLIDKAEEFIDSARARRASLIVAAVTGQIDVREAA